MAASDLLVTYRFHPVGQGLFSSGSLKWDGSSIDPFHWVYDCGTSSRQSLLKHATDNFAATVGSLGARPRVDLVTISHFDWDHISGLLELLTKFRVGVLLLPYMPLWQRLVVAFSQSVDTQQEFIDFFIDPAGYIVGRGGEAIDQIIFVPPGGEIVPPGEPGEPGLGFGPDTEARSLLLKADTISPEGEELMADFAAFSAPVQLSVLKPGGRLLVANGWEFIPYNDADLAPKASAAFQRQVSAKRKELLGNPNPQWRADALKELRDEYDKVFGRSAKNRNLISLFLYGGLVRPRPTAFQALVGAAWSLSSNKLPALTHLYFSGPRLSVLYTGDGFLDKKRRVDALLRYLGPTTRVARICVFQVMHHGAKANWRKGIAGTIQPCFSVFSSDPQHSGLQHPHEPVLRDFWTHGPIQVDKEASFSVEQRIRP